MFALRVAAAPLSSNRSEAKPHRTSPEASGARATVIDSQGQVLADSGATPETMENHARRPEFQAALAGQIGIDTRRSHTLGVDLLYVAQPVPGGAVRLAVPLNAIAEANQEGMALAGVCLRARLLHRDSAVRSGHPEA